LKFWDSSAIIPLLARERRSPAVEAIAREDGELTAWWWSPVECASAFARLRRDGVITGAQEDQLRRLMSAMSSVWTEIQPTSDVRASAQRLLLKHPLRAADALQLAAALAWAGRDPTGQKFVCLDSRLRKAARDEGFAILPEQE
jgi:predicted nucleic acid-binding protein